MFAAMSLSTLAFEVMDKEPSLIAIIVTYSVFGATGFALSRRKWWWGLSVLPLIVVFGWTDIAELHDRFVGPDIVREAGYLHVIVWCVFIVGSAAIVVLGAMRQRKRALYSGTR